jgi:hypothetical protein
MSLLELPRRRAAPRTFIEAPAGLERRVMRALSALGDLPDGFDLPGLEELGAALIELADAMEPDADLEPEEDADGEEERLPLFVFAGLTRRP